MFLFRDDRGKWRWQLIACNNWDVLGDSGQGYSERNKAARMARSIFAGSGYRLTWRERDGGMHQEVIP